MIPVIYKAGKQVYAADSALQTAADGGYYTQQGPKTNLTKPYIVGSVQSDRELDSFGSDGFRGLFAFNIYGPKYSSTSALSIADDTVPIILAIRKAYHNKSFDVTVDAVVWEVHFKAAYGIVIPERDDFWHHAETYTVTCFPKS